MSGKKIAAGIGVVGAAVAGTLIRGNMNTSCANCGRELKYKDTVCFKSEVTGEKYAVAVESALYLAGVKELKQRFCQSCAAPIRNEYKHYMRVAQDGYDKIWHYTVGYEGHPKHNRDSRMQIKSGQQESKADALKEAKMIAAMCGCDMLLEVDFTRHRNSTEQANGYIQNEYTWSCSAVGAIR